MPGETETETTETQTDGAGSQTEDAGASEPTTDSDLSLGEALDQASEETAEIGGVEGEVEESEGKAPGEETESESAPSAEGESPEEGGAEGEGEHAPEYLRWQADGDPDGTYRDAQGRLHDADSGEFLEGEAKEPPSYVTEVAEAEGEVSAEEAEEFFEGSDVEPVEFEVTGEDGETEQFELAVQDEEAREVLEERLEAASEAEELRDEIEEYRGRVAEIEAAEEELQTVMEGIKEDPSGFILQNLDASTDTRKALARDLLLDDDVFEDLAETIQNWQVNPSQRQVAKAERERDLAKREAEQVTSKTRRQRAKEIDQRINQVVPDDLERGDPEMLKDRIVLEINRAIENGEVAENQVSADNFTDIEGVRELLNVYGVDPDQTPAANGGRPEESSDVVEAEPAGEQERSLAERAEAARRYGVMLRKKREAREDAASTTPGGAGASPSTGGMPDDATLDEAIEELDRRTG